MGRVFQDNKERERLIAQKKNPDRAAWYAEVKMPGGRRRTKKIGLKRDAERVVAQWELEKRQRRAGVTVDMSWDTFRRSIGRTE